MAPGDSSFFSFQWGKKKGELLSSSKSDSTEGTIKEEATIIREGLALTELPSCAKCCVYLFESLYPVNWVVLIIPIEQMRKLRLGG